MASGLPNTQTWIKNHPNELSEATFFISHNWQKDEPFLVARRSHRGCPAFTLDLHHRTTEGGTAFQSCANVKTDRRQKGKPCSLCGDASEATRILDRSNVLRRNGFPDGQGWKTLLGDMQCAFRRLLDRMPSKD